MLEAIPLTRQRRARPASRRPIGRKLAVGALAFGVLAGSVPLAAARPVPESFADLVEQVAPAVVNISTLQTGPARPSAPFPEDHPFHEFFERFLDRDPPGFEAPEGGQREAPERRRVSGQGSGFVIDPDGYVVTNNHVIAQASEITVTLGNGSAYQAELVGRDGRTDLALLKVEAEGPLPTVAFGDSDRLRVGDWLMAVGNPYGLGGTVTAGIVSARGRDLRGGALNDFIQLDAPINRGNSGGPSFDLTGNVIGINTAIYSPTGGSVGIGFAIPSNVAAKVIADLRAHGQVNRGWLGVRIQPVTPDIAEGFGLDRARGALIASIEPDSPAAAAGLQPGDVVTGWDGRPVEALRDLPRLVADTPIGREVEVELWRDRKAVRTRATAGAAPQRQAGRLPEAPREQASTDLAGLGITVADPAPTAADGVRVVKVAPDSLAARQGLRPGDLIKRIGEEPVRTAEQAAVALARAAKSGARVVTLMTSRDGEDSFLALRLPEGAKLG